MKKSMLSALTLSAALCGCLALQGCADTRTETTYSSAPGEYPVETSTTTYTTTTTDDHDSVVGSTAHAAGTIIAAPFRIVGDALGTIF